MNKELYLTDLIDVDILQQIQDAFSDMTGMAALTTDKNGVAVTKGSNFTDFCMQHTRTSKLGCIRCGECDKKGAELTLANGSACSYYCHAGLVDFAAPIMADGKMVGSFIGGQVLTSPPDLEKVEKIALELGIDPEDYKNAVKRIKIVNKKKIDKSAKFLCVFANVLSDIAYKSYKLHQSNIEIEKASRLKSDFLANMSHEIRTPMNAVIGMADIALREEMSPAARNFIHQIKSSSKSLLVIINDILDFSKIESGKMEIVEVSYEPWSLINDLTSIINSRIGTKKIEFTMDISPELPQNILGDNIRIHQIMMNFLTNAVKFTQNGEINLKLECEFKDEETVILKCAIKDTGIGIKEDDLKKLFNSFQQVDSRRNRNIEGTGLGLAISRQLLTLMNGSVSVESKYGEGSTFSFELPQKVINNASSVPKLDEKYGVALMVENLFIKKQLIKDLQRIGADFSDVNSLKMLDEIKHDYIITEKKFFSKALEAYAVSHPDISCIVIENYDYTQDIDIPNVHIIRKPVYSLSLYNAMGISNISLSDETNEAEKFTFTAPDAHILIVDDNSINLTVAKGLIEPLNMCVDTALSAADAIEKVNHTKYDLIFMDHMMPEVDGVEATHMIRKLLPAYNDIPIIALTANAIGGAKEMFLREGLDDFVAKPIEVKEMISKLRKWLPQEKLIPVDKSQKNQQIKETKEISKTQIHIDELNIEEAISLLGSESLFLTVLKEYYLSIDKKSATIKEYQTTGRWREYTIEVHSLKSTSKQIGADLLSSLAAELERAGKENNIELINQKTDEMLYEYCKYKELLKPVFAETEVKSEIKTADNNDVLNMLEKMQLALEEFDILLIDDVVEEMSGYKYPDNMNGYFENLKNAVDKSDIEKCSDIISEWKKFCL